MKNTIKIKKVLKKGTGYILGKKPLYIITYVFFVTLSFFLFLYIMSSHISFENLIPEEIDTEALFFRFISSPNCFAYQDNVSGRIYPGIIDFEKFDNTINRRDGHISEECFNEKAKKSFRLTLVFDEYEKSVSTLNWDPIRFIEQTSQIVLVKDKNNYKSAKLLIEVGENG